MNAYMKSAIVTHAWHEFLYGYNNEDRKIFLNEMVEDYPIKIDNDNPAAIYIDDFMLPNISTSVNPERFRLEAVAREYFSFTLVNAIVEQSMKQIKLEELNNRMNKFIDRVNQLFVSNDDISISNISILRDALVTSKEFYKEQYMKLMKNGCFDGDVTSLPISFMDISMFANYFKRAIGMNRHFAVILDYQGTGAVVSQQAVNGLVTRRITGDYSVKVACQPEEWKNFYDFGGQFAESVHDYSVVELDDSFKSYIKKNMNR